MGVLLSSTKTVYRTVVTARGKRKDRKGVIRFPFFSFLLFLLTLNTQMIFRTEKDVFCVGKICWKRLARFLWSHGNTCDAVSQQTFLVFQDVFKTSSRRLQDVFAIRLLKTSSRRLKEVFARRLQDVFKKMSCNYVCCYQIEGRLNERLFSREFCEIKSFTPWCSGYHYCTTSFTKA